MTVKHLIFIAALVFSLAFVAGCGDEISDITTSCIDTLQCTKCTVQTCADAAECTWYNAGGIIFPADKCFASATDAEATQALIDAKTYCECP